MIQLGGILGEITAAIRQVMFLAGKEVLKMTYRWHQN